MFDIGWSELLVIGVVAIIVVGPKDLPRLMRTFGHYAGKLRRMAAEFQRQFEDAVRDSEIDEVRKAMQDFRDEAPSVDFRASVDKPLMVSQQTPTPRAAPTPEPPPVSPQAVPKPRAKRIAADTPKATPPKLRKAAKAKAPQSKAPKSKPPKPKAPKAKAPQP
jgi:sec-independent protein translocase protein TatB